jgi:lauroyl/myristoyl acyltransferase
VIFGEHPAKDLYRQVVWGPYRRLLQAAPAGTEIRANRALGRLLSHVAMGRRLDLKNKLTSALGPDKRLDSWVEECFETHIAQQYLGFSFAKIQRTNWHQYLHFEGLEKLDQALAKGQGVVIAHPHLGLPQLPLHVLGLLGYDVHQVGGGQNQVHLSPMGEWALGMRLALEGDICARCHDGKGYLRPLLRVLEANGVVLTACDATGGGREIGRREMHQVLGQTIGLPLFPAWLAEKTGAVILSMATWHDEGCQSITRLDPPIDGKPMEELARRLERWLREHPGQWHFWDQWHGGEGGLLIRQ